jgi:HEAT repeat protein
VPSLPVAAALWRHRLAEAFTPDRVLALVSALWLVLLWKVPLYPVAAGLGTFGLMIGNFRVGVELLFVRKRVAVLLGLAQLALFTAVHYQIYTYGDRNCYACDRVPRVWDWVQFTAAHVLRAADVLDFLEEFGIDVQNITHAQWFPGLILVLMHVTVDVFLLGVALRWGRKFWQRIARMRATSPATTAIADQKATAERFRHVLERATRWSLVVCVLLILGTAYVQAWRGSDWVLWPLDNLLRLVDFADAMQVFHWQLHGVESSYWLAALAVALRLFVGVTIAERLNYAQLKWLGFNALRTIEDFAEDLVNPRAEVRRAAAEVFKDTEWSEVWDVPTDEHAIVPVLVQALRDADPVVRQVAARTLNRIHPNWPSFPSAVPTLLEALVDPNDDVCRIAATQLGRFGSTAESAVPVLLRALADTDREVCQRAARGLGLLGRYAASAVPALTRALADTHAEVRCQAARALGLIGPAAQSAVPALIQALADSSAHQRGYVVQALAQMGPSTVPTLIQALADSDEWVRGLTASCLASIGQPAIVALTQALADSDRHVRWRAANALKIIGPAARSAVPVLTQALADNDEHVRRIAAEALATIDPTRNTNPR